MSYVYIKLTCFTYCIYCLYKLIFSTIKIDILNDDKVFISLNLNNLFLSF